MKSVFLSFVLVGVLVAGASCTKTNPALCCTGPADCEAVGLPDVVDCNFGLRCEGNVCVRPNCLIDTDCPATQPACADGLCYECDDTHACGTTDRPVCYERTCVQCDETHACGSDAPICQDNSCVQCDATTACGAAAPVCDLGDNTCNGCATNPDCATFPTTPLCNTESGSCAECNASVDCAGLKPVCDAHACRACVLDSECETGACDEDGSCVPESAIVWLSPTPGSGNTCTTLDPCPWDNFFPTLLTEGRRHVVLAPGLYQQGFVVFSSTAYPSLPLRTYVHGAGATVTLPPTLNRPVLDALRAMTIRNLTFGARASVSLRSAVFNFESVAFVGSDKLSVASSLVARNLTIYDTLGAIQIAATGDLTIDGGTITGGLVGIGATAVGARVHLKNLIISGTALRALDLANGQGELEFSTIVDSGEDTTTAPCSVSCTSLLNVRSSIIWNQTCANGTAQNASSSCTFASSIVANLPVLAGFTNVDPQFVNRVGADYHILSTSPATDAVDTGPAFDFEGDPRPRGLKFDIGADEAP